MRVRIPSALHSYTGGQSVVEASGATVGAVIQALEERFRGFRFRIVDEQDRVRPHIRITVNMELVDGLAAPLRAGDEVAIIMAFSGG